MSERRACRVIGYVRMAVRYRSRRIDDAGLRERLRTLAKKRRRFGYRRLQVLLRREGFFVNHKGLFRINREERLMVRKRGGHKRALGTRAPHPREHADDSERYSLMMELPPEVGTTPEGQCRSSSLRYGLKSTAG